MTQATVTTESKLQSSNATPHPWSDQGLEVLQLIDDLRTCRLDLPFAPFRTTFLRHLARISRCREPPAHPTRTLTLRMNFWSWRSPNVVFNDESQASWEVGLPETEVIFVLPVSFIAACVYCAAHCAVGKVLFKEKRAREWRRALPQQTLLYQPIVT